MSLLINISPLETSNTKLAAALCAVGIRLRKDTPVRLITGGKGDSHCFFFEPQSACGNYNAVDLIKAWDDKEWHMKNPEHPFAFLKVAFENQERLTDYIRRGEKIAIVEKGSKFGFLSIRAGDAAQKIFFKELNRH